MSAARERMRAAVADLGSVDRLLVELSADDELLDEMVAFGVICRDFTTACAERGMNHQQTFALGSGMLLAAVDERHGGFR